MSIVWSGESRTRRRLDSRLPDVLVTGASGFVGTRLCSALDDARISYRRALRSARGANSNDVVLGEFGPDTDWRQALRGVRAVVHLAARTHVMHDPASDPLEEYRRINVAATKRLAETAASQGVHRFIFLSSIKVNGERTIDRPFRESDQPRPEDPYGVSKLEAETELQRIAASSSMGATILRPPLIYGPGVKANFLALMRAIHKGVPLPFASIDNRRSLVFVGNLVSAIVACLRDDRARSKVFLVSDGEDLSTPGLVRGLAGHMGRRSRLLPFPPMLLRGLATMSGQRAKAGRLIDSLQIDSSSIRETLGWTPPYSTGQGLDETAQWFVSMAQ